MFKEYEEKNSADKVTYIFYEEFAVEETEFAFSSFS